METKQNYSKMKGMELSKIRKEYKFAIDQEEQIIEARNWLLAKYKTIFVKTNIEIANGRPQEFVTLTAKRRK